MYCDDSAAKKRPIPTPVGSNILKEWKRPDWDDIPLFVPDSPNPSLAPQYDKARVSELEIGPF